MNNHEIPKIDSIQELAQFWDTHDLTEFENQLDKVSEAVFERKTEIKIHLQPDEAKLVKEIACSKGVSYSELIHEWIVERIQT